MTAVIHDRLGQAGLTPGEHVTDSGYASADHLVAARELRITMITPLLPDPRWQAREGGYTSRDFAVDWDARPGHLPPGHRQQNLEPLHGQRRAGHRRPVPSRRLPRLPRPGQVHPVSPLRAPAHPPPTPRPRSRRRRPRPAGNHPVAGPVAPAAPASRAS